MRSTRRRKLPLREAKRSGAQEEEEVVTETIVVSPVTKKRKRLCNRNIQRQAFDEVLMMIAANGGKLKYGMIARVVNEYHKLGHLFVTRRNLDYRYQLHEAGQTLKDEMVVPCNVGGAGMLGAVTIAVSSITSNNNMPNNSNIDTVNSFNEEQEEVVRDGVIQRNKDKSHDLLQKKNDATSVASFQYAKLRETALDTNQKVEPGSLNQIIKQNETLYGLVPGSITKKNVLHRVYVGNPAGVLHQRTSPLVEIEPLILEYCIKLAEIGSALTRSEVIALTKEIIEGTIYEQKILEYKLKRKVNTSELLGFGWYRGFMKRNHDAIRRRRCKVRDQKRLTWCTYEHFEDMYDSIYARMVEAGVATKYDNLLMFDKEGNEVDDENKMYGRKTRYRMTCPDNVVFVDETG